MADHFKLEPRPATATPAHELREADVLAYLKRYPRVLLSQPDLFASLTPEARFEADAVVVDMQKFIVERLRRQVDNLKASSEKIISNTRANMSLVERTLECALALIYAGSYAEISQVMHEDMPLHLGVDAVSVAFETDRVPVDAAYFARTLPEGTVARLIGANAYRIRPDTQGEAAIYGTAAGLVRSDALIKLDASEALPVGVFAIGCRNPGYFDKTQGTELIAFLAQIARYAIGRWWLTAI
ncbi:MAG: DUF484 family protein [Alphaproteobacteria bacterium]|nr:DUF484 family protein [Alphaproteobacteria bacterium]